MRTELQNAREGSDELFKIISPDVLYERPVADRHRLIFYLGHLDAFDWNVIARRSMGAPSFHPEFDRLFERGIDPELGQAPSDAPQDWPSQYEVEAYSTRTREWLDEHLDEIDPRILRMVIEHRLMHVETLAYLLHNLPHELKSGPLPRAVVRTALQNAMVQIPAGSARLGTPQDSFGWDNERPSREWPVSEFAMSKFKICNGEYREFLKANPDRANIPNFWQREGDEWMWRGMFGLVPLPLDWPVWVTWRQANAYAMWRGARLPSEAEWLRASRLQKPDALRDNFGLTSWDPIPVDAGEPQTSTASVPAQLTGNGWEWTRDVFAPFAGFQADPIYPGYSADFFDGEHYVMKGASPRTPALLARQGFRNWFRPEYPYVYAGFRIVSESNPNTLTVGN